MQVGQVITAISGTRPISVTIVAITEDGIRLRCGTDWSFQAGSEFVISLDRFPGSIWALAAPELLSAAQKARAALSELLMTRDPIVYSDALRELDAAIEKATGEAA